MILVHKYIAPGTLLNWIGKERKSRVNVFNQWKEMTLASLDIGSYLVWRVRDGSQVRVGGDAIMGCGRDIFLLDEII
jgi:hypothetical protein